VVEEEDGDLMGDGVNIAARLEGVAQPGAICLSEQAYWQVKGRLDLKVTDLGATQLKNIAEPIHVYSLEVGQPSQAKPIKSAVPKRRSLLAPLVAALLALLVVIAGGAWWFLNANRPASVATKAPAEAARLSIVVLPFANLSRDQGQEYLVDALTDELTTSLARIRGTFVIARNTAMTFKGIPVDAKAIGKDLGVHYVLEGSVQPGGNQVRVNAQLIDADSGAHVWADQFDTPRSDLLQMQDEIVTRLARALELQFPEAEAARANRTPAANPDAEDLALQCWGILQKGGYIGKEADTGFSLCDKALAIDPHNVRALVALSVKFYLPVVLGVSADPKADLKRGDDLVSQALALDPSYSYAHGNKAIILLSQGRPDEAIHEGERALTLDPANVFAYASLSWDYFYLGQFERSLEFSDKAIRLSPHDPNLDAWYAAKASANFGLKQYDRAIDAARQAIAISPAYNPYSHGNLVAALALTGHETEAHEALQRYLALPGTRPRTIAAWKALDAHYKYEHEDPRILELNYRFYDGLRKAGMPEE
jgi:TolB-like protein/Tfp pilus assembly protein PilF